MRHLNYDHLRYFWVIARTGSVTAAARELNLTPQTVSGQVKLLESRVNGALLERAGRRLVLTELGRVVFSYADDIFRRGEELASVVRGARPAGRRTLVVGVSDVVPKLVTWRVLSPVTAGEDAVRVVCREGNISSLLGALAAHEVDLILATHAVGAESGVRVVNHPLGESELAFFASPALARRARGAFPARLATLPWLLPAEGTAARRALDAWLDAQGIVPIVAGEFDDSALVKTFGQGGAGIFCAPAVIAREIVTQHRVRQIGQTADIRARFYAITAGRAVRHPAIAEVLAASIDERR
jgi:LysR family transcriptional activator of nhaA